MEVVHLARHGQTEWNVAGRRQGQLDSPLSVVGRANVERLATVLSNFPIDRLFSSPLGRAVATATIYGKSLGLSVEVVDELRELDHGMMAGLTNEEIEERFPGALAMRSKDRYRWCFPGGESYAGADERAAVALKRIDSTGAQRPLLVSHEMLGRMLLRNLLCVSAEEALEFTQPSGTVYRIDVAEERLSSIDIDIVRQ
jgi:broad specificity phosphatase PhoE